MNDRLRRDGLGGMAVGTRGFLVLDAVTQLAVLTVGRDFEAFGSAGGPWGEHVCAVVEVTGRHPLEDRCPRVEPDARLA